MVRDSVQLETAVNTISHEYLLEFTSEYGIPEMLHLELPGPRDRIVDFPEDKVDERVFPTVVDWRTNASKDGIPVNGTYSVEAVRALDTHQMDIFNLIRAPNPTKVKTGSRPRAPHEVPLLTLTASRVIEMDEPAVATDSSGVPSTIEKSSLDFANEGRASDQGTAAPGVPPPEDVPAIAAPEVGQAEEAVAAEPYVARESRKRGPDGVDANAPPKSSPGAVAAEDPESENASSPTEVGSPGSVYRPEWGVTNGNLLDTPKACQDLVDHVAPPDYFSELRHMRNEDFLGQYNVNLARQVALGSQLRLRFEQEAKLLRKSVAQVARRDKRIEARELEIKNLEALLETEADMKRAAEDKSAGRIKELEDMRAQFSDLQVSHGQLSQQVASLKEQVSGEEKLKAAFEQFKQYEDERVERRCAELDVCLDALSIAFDEELYLHMLTAIAGRRWVVGHGLRLAMMKCAESLEMRQAFADVVSAGVAKGISEGLKHGVEHRQAQLTVESIEAYDPEAEAKFVAALQSLKDLKYPLLDQLEGLKDAPMDVIMAALYLESDTGGMLHNIYATSVPVPLSSPSPCTRMSDDVPVSVPTVVPQGLALLLVDSATQTDLEDA
nr:hypothetical protein [Tanacetum cinerariifolium]